MTSGAQSKAQRLVGAANQVIAQHLDTGNATVPDAIGFLGAHGINRGVDREVRRVQADRTPWGDLDAEAARAVAALDLGLVVLLGAHRNGHVREAIVQYAADLTHVPGAVSMLALRCVDRVPPVRETAQKPIRTLFETELDDESDGVMSTVVNRAAKGVVVSPDSVIHCPDLVVMALKLFETRTPRWRRDRGRDHHERTLKEIDRRSQVLEHLRQLEPTLDDEASREACSQLIEFYQHSLVLTPRGVSTS